MKLSDIPFLSEEESTEKDFDDYFTPVNAEEYADEHRGYWLYYDGQTEGPFDSYEEAEDYARQENLITDEYYIVEFDPDQDGPQRFTFQ